MTRSHELLRRRWQTHQKLKQESSEVALRESYLSESIWGTTMTNVWSNETPEERESRLAMAACMNADVIFRGVCDGLCYFEGYFEDEVDGPRAVLSLPTEGLTPEKISNHAAEADGSGIEQRRLREQREQS